MALKFILVLILFYFIGKTVSNLIRAIVKEPQTPPRMPSRPPKDRSVPWQGPTAEQTRTRRDHVEEAKWVDL